MAFDGPENTEMDQDLGQEIQMPLIQDLHAQESLSLSLQKSLDALLIQGLKDGPDDLYIREISKNLHDPVLYFVQYKKILENPETKKVELKFLDQRQRPEFFLNSDILDPSPYLTFYQGRRIGHWDDPSNLPIIDLENLTGYEHVIFLKSLQRLKEKNDLCIKNHTKEWSRNKSNLGLEDFIEPIISCNDLASCNSYPIFPVNMYKPWEEKHHPHTEIMIHSKEWVWGIRGYPGPDTKLNDLVLNTLDMSKYTIEFDLGPVIKESLDQMQKYMIFLDTYNFFQEICCKDCLTMDSPKHQKCQGSCSNKIVQSKEKKRESKNSSDSKDQQKYWIQNIVLGNIHESNPFELTGYLKDMLPRIFDSKDLQEIHSLVLSWVLDSSHGSMLYGQINLVFLGLLAFPQNLEYLLGLEIYLERLKKYLNLPFLIQTLFQIAFSEYLNKFEKQNHAKIILVPYPKLQILCDFFFDLARVKNLEDHSRYKIIKEIRGMEYPEYVLNTELQLRGHRTNLRILLDLFTKERSKTLLVLYSKDLNLKMIDIIFELNKKQAIKKLLKLLNLEERQRIFSEMKHDIEWIQCAKDIIQDLDTSFEDRVFLMDIVLGYHEINPMNNVPDFWNLGQWINNEFAYQDLIHIILNDQNKNNTSPIYTRLCVIANLLGESHVLEVLNAMSHETLKFPELNQILADFKTFNNNLFLGHFLQGLNIKTKKIDVQIFYDKVLDQEMNNAE